MFVQRIRLKKNRYEDYFLPGKSLLIIKLTNFQILQSPCWGNSMNLKRLHSYSSCWSNKRYHITNLSPIVKRGLMRSTGRCSEGLSGVMIFYFLSFDNELKCSLWEKQLLFVLRFYLSTELKWILWSTLSTESILVNFSIEYLKLIFGGWYFQEWVYWYLSELKSVLFKIATHIYFFKKNNSSKLCSD